MDRDQPRFPPPGEQPGGWRDLRSFLLIMSSLPFAAILIVGAVVFGLVAILIGGAVAYSVVYNKLVPAASAETFIRELNASVRLELYLTFGDQDSGRYLVVDTPKGRISGTLAGWDWAHWSRTSLYRTDDGKIAVLGVAYADHIIDPSNLTITNLTGQVTSDSWSYLGAFDGGSRLRFIPATEQRECNPTAMSEEEPPPWAARRQSRHEWCRQDELAR